MKRASPELFHAVWEHARQIHSQNDDIYPKFLEEARSELPEHAEDPQFPYIVRRIWMEDGPEAQEFWEASLLPELRSTYMRFDALTNQSLEGETVEGWITTQLVHYTLSLWQRRVPYRMGVEHALRMLRSTGRIAALGVRV